MGKTAYRNILFTAFVFLTNLSFGQNKITDSLLGVLKMTNEEATRVTILNELGDQLLKYAEYDRVISYEKEAVLISGKTNLKKELAIAMNNIGRAIVGKGNYGDALEHHQQALQIAKEIGDKRSIADSYTNIGYAYFNKSNFAEALKNYQLAHDLRTELSDQRGIADLDTKIGLVYIAQWKISEALDKELTSLKFYQGYGDKYGIAISFYCIGKAYYGQENFFEAIKNLNASINISAEEGFKFIFALDYLTLGNTNINLGNYQEALKNFLLALKTSEEIRSNSILASTLNGVGIVYESIENYEEALSYYNQAVEVERAWDYKGKLALTYMNIGNTYEFIAKRHENVHSDSVDFFFNRCIESHFKALEINKSLGDSAAAGGVYINLGNVFLSKDDYDQSLHYFKQALNIFEVTGEKRGLQYCYGGIGASLYNRAIKSNGRRDEINEAIEYLNKGVQIGREKGLREGIMYAYRLLANLYEAINDYKSALGYRKLFSELRDSLLNDETKKKIEQSKLQYEIEKVLTEERAKTDKEKSEMQYAFGKREDSIKYQQNLTSLQLTQQTLFAKQKDQELLLKQNSLDLVAKENEINRLSFLKSQADLKAEQSQRSETEKQLTIADQEKNLQTDQLTLEHAQIRLRENEIHTVKKQRYFYAAGLVLVCLSFLFAYRNFKIRQKANELIATERLKSEKADAAHKMAELELQSLRAQLNPHFMFNSLNAIQELILTEDNERSHVYLSAFSDLLRMLLDNAEAPFISLKKEIGFLELYLSLESLRIPNLEYSIKVDPGINMEKTKIPNMMLQPYIENAIWHGLSHKKENRSLLIKVAQKENALAFEIRDNGIGRKKATEFKSQYRKEHKSKGMELLSKRFTLLSKEYATDITTVVTDLYQSGEASGTLVEILVPVSLSEKIKEPYGTYDHN